MFVESSFYLLRILDITVSFYQSSK